VVLRILLAPSAFRLQDYHLLWSDFPDSSARLSGTVMQSYNPSQTGVRKVWAGPISLAATFGISIDFYSSRYLDVSVPWVLPPLRDDRALPRPGFPIRTPPDQRLFATPRGFSQLTASFIACMCQGIHRMPLVA
jgi:hypothetical protein